MIVTNCPLGRLPLLTLRLPCWPLEKKQYRKFQLLPAASQPIKILGILIAFKTAKFLLLPKIQGNQAVQDNQEGASAPDCLGQAPCKARRLGVEPHRPAGR
jgi:hypothetical protein